MGCSNSKDSKKPKEPEKPEKKPAETKRAGPTEAELEAQRREAEAKRAAAFEKERVQRIKAIQAHHSSSPYRYDACTIQDGDIRGYFEGGIIYRIIKDGAWHLYNDSLDYEAHVDFRFGPGSQITPGENVTVEQMVDGWTCARTVVYPLETKLYITGSPNGYKSSINIKPIGDEYRKAACEEARATLERETAAVRRIAGNDTDEGVILRRCVANKTPYVDLLYPPTAESVARADRDARMIPPMPMMRPTQYLPAEKRSAISDIAGPVVPHAIDQGNLGDSWLMCAAAIMAEDDAMIRSIFSQGVPAEKAIGAYRVMMNKNGWWRTVIVDDFLPTISRMPVFAHATDRPTEMWVALLEKAYAKVHGSYASITGGDALQALVDFSGSPMYRFDKDWETVVLDPSKSDRLFRMLVDFSNAQTSMVLSTPGHTSESYLGRTQTSGAAAFAARYTAIGLNPGYTYFVERVVMAKGRNTLLFKIRNPWRSSGTWTGAWSYGSAQWQEYPEVCSFCNAQTDPRDGSFWMEWEDARNFFDGGGVVFCDNDATDYRIKGSFEDNNPSAILHITATEQTKVLLTLSQPDKRGISHDDDAALFAPIMLSLSRRDGDVQRVEKNTGWNPSMPSEEFNFVVGREVAMWCTLQPGAQYEVVPRIHRKGIKSGYDRPYVMGIISSTPLNGKVRVEARHLSDDSKAFTNFVAYEPAAPESIEVEHQMKAPGQAPLTRVSRSII